jgi:undecaprenyl-phosphate 4-deoxy-4-formamido-L-arabinose transferase
MDVMDFKEEIDFISVVIPVYNEEKVLDELLKRCLESCRQTQKRFEIILIDDGSADDSANILRKYASKNIDEVIAVILNRNYGQHSAIMAGFAQVRGDLVITLDADLQNPPEEIPVLVKTAEEGYDVVGTVRQKRQDTLFRRTASKVVNKITQKATGVKMRDYGCMLRAYRRHIVDAMLECRESSTFIPVLGNSFARRTIEIDVSHSERAAGESKYSLWKLVNLQFNLLTCSTTEPLRIVSIIGTLAAIVGGFLSIYIFIRRFTPGGDDWAQYGTFTLFAILFIFTGFQMIGIGLLGEYIGRIYHDVRARPRYYIREIVGHEKKEDNE